MLVVASAMAEAVTKMRVQVGGWPHKEGWFRLLV